MKSAIVLCFFGLCAVALARPGDDEHYTDKWDGVNIPEIIANTKLFDAYYKCIMDEGKCTADGKELRSHIQEALETHCLKCTKAQRDGVEKVIGHLINNDSVRWDKLKAKYDPTGKYSAEYEEELKTVMAPNKNLKQ